MGKVTIWNLPGTASSPFICKVSNFPETRVTLSSAEKLDILRNKFVEKLDNSIKLHDTLYGFKEKTLAETRLLLKFNSQILFPSNFSNFFLSLHISVFSQVTLLLWKLLAYFLGYNLSITYLFLVKIGISVREHSQMPVRLLLIKRITCAIIWM